MGSRSAKHIKTERDEWNYLNGNGRRHAVRRRVLYKRFNKMFHEKGMSMQKLVGWAAATVGNGRSFHPKSRGASLAELHPDAFGFLSRFGTEYKKSHRWESPPSFGEPLRKGCYKNAARLMYGTENYRKKYKNISLASAKRAFVYVEGIAHGPLVHPMQHGWNAVGVRGKTAYDWTFYAVNHYTKYIGVPLSVDEFKKLCACISPKCMRLTLFHPKIFPRIKLRLVQIIQARKRAGKMVRIRDKKRGRR